MAKPDQNALYNLLRMHCCYCCCCCCCLHWYCRLFSKVSCSHGPFSRTLFLIRFSLKCERVQNPNPVSWIQLSRNKNHHTTKPHRFGSQPRMNFWINHKTVKHASGNKVAVRELEKKRNVIVTWSNLITKKFMEPVTLNVFVWLWNLIKSHWNIQQ